jgi:hypothetical protein
VNDVIPFVTLDNVVVISTGDFIVADVAFDVVLTIITCD